MKSSWFLYVFSLYLISDVFCDTPESLEKGWGTEIEWMSLKDARSQATKSNKPVMVLITKSWCGACKVLRPKFAESKPISILSKNFLMVHREDEDEPEGDEFQVDGRYIPRIFFLGTDGKIMKDIFNTKGKHVKDYKYYYGKVSQIVDNMKTVLKKLNIAFEDVQETNSLARGFGEGIDWKTFKEGLHEANDSKKMLLLIIHKSWCGACKTLKPKLAASEKLAEISKQFVMVNVEDNEEPAGSQFVVDGEYVPRIFFMDPDGFVNEKIWNEGSKFPHTRYYYSSADELTAAMKRALEKPKEEAKKEEKKEEKKEKSEEQKEDKKKPWWTPGKEAIDDISNGFGNYIQWHTYDNGLKLAKESNKPMILIIHKENCPSCKTLKGRISIDKKLGEYSKTFVMVNVEGSSETEIEKFKPDGSYVPRMLFLDSNGKVMKDFWNEGTNFTHVKYYYQDGEELIRSMERVLKSRKPADDFGWGTSFDWIDINNAFPAAQDRNVPVLLIMHKSWCSACKAFKKKFSKSDNLIKLSRNFAMVNIQDDDSKAEKQYDVDGAYVPRFYFIDPFTKKIMKTIYNEDPSYGDYKYAYGEARQLVKSMKKALAVEISKPATDQGFGSEISWVPLNDALTQAKPNEKPIMMILHRTWCQHSQALKSKISESKEIAELSKVFIMVNLQDDEIPSKTYDIDGTYVPRIVFLDHNGEVQKHVTNPNTPVDDAEYFYDNPTDIINSMKRMSPGFSLDRGFGKNIPWMTLKEGLKRAKQSNKPAMVIIHKTWCGACKVLKPHIANSTEIQELSKKFIMINLEDDEEPKDSKFDVDGKYFPRVFFLDPYGDVLKDVHNTELKYLKFKYAHADAETVLKAMKMAHKKYDGASSEPVQEKTEQKQETKKTEKTETKSEAEKDTSIARGLGKDIAWVSLDEGYITARKSWKPMMLIVHKSWCTACQAFQPKFVASKEIKELSKNFVMVNVEDDFDHTDSRFDIDGAYIPRTMFITPLGEMIKDIWNVDTPYPENKYYHYDSPSVVKAMKKAMETVEKMEKIDQRDEL